MELWLVLIISGLAILFAIWLAKSVLKRDTGTPEMQTISNAIKEGAEAFLARQNKTIGTLAIAVAALIFILYAFIREQSSADPVAPMWLAFWTIISFVLGATRSEERRVGKECRL